MPEKRTFERSITIFSLRLAHNTEAPIDLLVAKIVQSSLRSYFCSVVIDWLSLSSPLVPDRRLHLLNRNGSLDNPTKKTV
jgi:hypothetical protein